MSNEKELVLDIRDLVVHFEVDGDVIKAVNDVTIQLERARPWVWWARPAPVRPPPRWQH